MATKADLIKALIYIKSGYVGEVIHFEEKQEAPFVFEDINFPEAVKEWIESTYYKISQQTEKSDLLDAEERNMLTIVSQVFLELETKLQSQHKPGALGAGIASILCQTLLNLKEGENIRQVLSAKIQSYLQKSQLQANPQLVGAQFAEKNLAEENEVLKMQLAQLKREQEAMRAKFEKSQSLAGDSSASMSVKGPSSVVSSSSVNASKPTVDPSGEITELRTLLAKSQEEQEILRVQSIRDQEQARELRETLIEQQRLQDQSAQQNTELRLELETLKTESQNETQRKTELLEQLESLRNQSQKDLSDARDEIDKEKTNASQLKVVLNMQQHDNEQLLQQNTRLQVEMQSLVQQVEDLTSRNEELRDRMEAISQRLRNAGNIEENNKQFDDLKRALIFYDKEMESVVNYATQAAEAKEALLHTVLYMDDAQKETARIIRDVYRVKGHIIKEKEEAKKVFAAYEKETKKPKKQEDRMAVRNKHLKDITEANVSKQTLQEHRQKILKGAKEVLEFLKRSNQDLLKVLDLASQPLPEPVSPKSSSAISMSLLSNMMSSSAGSASNAGESKALGIDAPSVNWNPAPPMAPSLNVPPPPGPPGPPGPPPPPGPPNMNASVAGSKPLRPVSVTSESVKPVARPNMVDLFKQGVPTLKKAGVRPLSDPSSVGSSASAVSATSSLTDALKGRFKQQSLTILEKEPTSEELKSQSNAKIVYKNAENQWMLLPNNKTDLSKAIAMKDVAKLASVLETLKSKDVKDFTPAEKEHMTRDVSSYLATTQTVATSNRPAVAPKQKFDQFDLVASRVPPETFSKFTYHLSKDDDKNWILKLYIPSAFISTRKGAPKQDPVMNIPVADVKGFAESLEEHKHKELHAITAGDFWGANKALKSYHTELLKSRKLHVEQPGESASHTHTAPTSLTNTLDAVMRDRRSQLEGSQSSSTLKPGHGRKDSWD